MKPLSCGCRAIEVGEVDEIDIEFCPMHEAAPQMLEALKLSRTELVESAVSVDSWAIIALDTIIDYAKKK